MSQPSASLATGQPDWIAEALDEARAGRRDALGRLVVEFSPLLWQVARTAGPDPGASEDVGPTTSLPLPDPPGGILPPAALLRCGGNVLPPGAGPARAPPP